MESVLWSMAGIVLGTALGYALGKKSRGKVRRDELKQSEPAAVSEAAGETGPQELLQTVSYLRHDWMNDIQVLSGYIQLKKYDYLLPYMEKIKLKMQNESGLAKLGIPSLIAYLLTFRSECKAFELELELPEELNIARLPIDVLLPEKVIRIATAAFREHARDYADEPNVLSLQLEPEQHGLLLDFAYHGQYDAEGLRLELESRLRNIAPGVTEVNEFHEGMASVTLCLPYREHRPEP